MVAGEWGHGIAGLTVRPFNRHHHLAPRITPPAPQPRFEIEHRRVGRQREPLDPQLLRRQQLGVAASDALRFHVIAGAKILDASGAERDHLPPTMLPICSRSYRMPDQPRQSIRLLPMMTEREFRYHHERRPARLRAVAASATTAGVKARLNAQAQEHERLARQLAELDVAD